jgi:hypothetical protein
MRRLQRLDHVGGAMKQVRYPASVVATPTAIARWVLPAPGVPSRITLRLFSTNRRVERSATPAVPVGLEVEVAEGLADWVVGPAQPARQPSCLGRLHIQLHQPL